MGIADIQSVLGNRVGVQQGYNFDETKTHIRYTKEERKKSKPRCYDFENDRYIFIDDLDTSYGEFPDNVCNEQDTGAHIWIEGATLCVEFLLTKTKTDYNHGVQYGTEKENREFERKFMKEVYPHVLHKKVYTARADCDDWVLRFEEGLKNIEYFETGNGIFKLGNYLKNVEDPPTSEDVFGKMYIPKKHEVWVRVFYDQIYDSVINNNLSMISDECLVHVARELGAKNAEKVKVGKLFKWVRDRIVRRYFPDYE